MPEAQSRRFHIVSELHVAGKLSAKVAGNHLLLSVTRRSERCRSGSEIPGAGLYKRQGAERRRGGVEGCGIRDDLMVGPLKVNQSATCRRAIQRIMVRIKEHCENGEYRSTTEAENEFRRLVESDLACK
jgi:hypothetical protein